jgi:hypothetical protein
MKTSPIRRNNAIPPGVKRLLLAWIIGTVLPYATEAAPDKILFDFEPAHMQVGQLKARDLEKRRFPWRKH